MFTIPIALFAVLFIIFMTYIWWKNKNDSKLKEGQRSLLENLINKDIKRVEDEEAAKQKEAKAEDDRRFKEEEKERLRLDAEAKAKLKKEQDE